jgi:non-specific serine/threonine protein kinase/serine/threonine-protein kinase
MRRDDWAAAETAFEAALAAGDGWKAVLDAHCGERTPMRVEVEALLAAHRRAGSFMTPVAFTRATEGGDIDAETASARLDHSAAGTTVGAFRLVERIGQGGMGDVYRAERVSGGFAQHVAIKLIAARLDGVDTVQRFRAERQILASLQHPNIVTLIDGGVTAAGQPYLVMEYVDGVPLTEYCAARSLGLAERLSIFKQVLAAVAHAHSHLVVHRDLKPANVLVTTNGLVKVLDFGVARLLERPDALASATGALLGPMTPDYASPEQVRGLAVTTSCDVYSLGVMLYELVAGRRPYETAGRSVAEVVGMVAEREPARPSAAAAPDLPYEPRRLKGDIDAIVSTAMAKERSRRYNSASELDDELARFLDARPVFAREPTLSYLAQRAIARHRVSFSIAAVSLCLLVGASVFALWQARVAARERQRAVERYGDVRELASSMIFRIHDDVKALPGSTPVRRTVLAEGLKFLERLEADATDDPALRVQIGEGYLRIGAVLGAIGDSNLGDRDGAVRSYRRAIDVVSPLVVPGVRATARTPAGPVEALHVAAKAHLALAAVLDGAEADVATSRALELASERHRLEPGSVPALELLASVHFQYALNAGYPGSLPHWQEAKRLFESILAADPDAPVKLRNVALVEKYLGGYYERAHDPAQALAHHERAYELDARRLRATPDSRQAQIDLAIDLSNLANAHEERGELQKAIDLYRQSLAMRERISTSDPADVYARGRVAYVHDQLALLNVKLGQLGTAREHAQTAVRLNRGLVDLSLQYRAQQARAYLTLGRVETAARTPAAACASLATASALFAGLAGDRVVAEANRVPAAFAAGRLAECGR